MIFKLPTKKQYQDNEIVTEVRFLILPLFFGGHVYWFERVRITKTAFNMYYEASHWVSWTIESVEVVK